MGFATSGPAPLAPGHARLFAPTRGSCTTTGTLRNRWTECCAIRGITSTATAPSRMNRCHAPTTRGRGQSSIFPASGPSRVGALGPKRGGLGPSLGRWRRTTRHTHRMCPQSKGTRWQESRVDPAAEPHTLAGSRTLVGLSADDRGAQLYDHLGVLTWGSESGVIGIVYSVVPEAIVRASWRCHVADLAVADGVSRRRWEVS